MATGGEQHASQNIGHRAYMTPTGWGCLDCNDGTHPMQKMNWHEVSGMWETKVFDMQKSPRPCSHMDAYLPSHASNCDEQIKKLSRSNPGK